MTTQTYLIMIEDKPFMLASSVNEAHELLKDHFRRAGKASRVDLYIEHNGTFQLRKPCFQVSGFMEPVRAAGFYGRGF